MSNKLTQRDKLLQILKINGKSGVNSFTYHYLSYRLAARIFELRKLGYHIITRNEKDNSATYILVNEPIGKPAITAYKWVFEEGKARQVEI